MRDAVVGTSPTRRLAHADRREAAARRLCASEALIARLEEALGPQTPQSQSLLSAVRALFSVSGRLPDVDLMVSVGPDHRDAVRLHKEDGDLQADLVRTTAAGTVPVVVALAAGA